ncbi:hypothetical protein Poly30_53380 [Planctomycetes bacterium Poly30]|uniref:Uncharacterized protein n=1 Tax=Saltatorellus ferox TaxID=2528018 RepID=A0A518F0A3_9BACT|nr:hypothetical protein Poly30_53380 [Planctomycetes bacterium Poly30]
MATQPLTRALPRALFALIASTLALGLLTSWKAPGYEIEESELGSLPADGSWLRIREIYPGTTAVSPEGLSGKVVSCRRKSWRFPDLFANVTYLLTLEHPGMRPRAAFLPAGTHGAGNHRIRFSDQLPGWVTFQLSLSGAVPEMGTEVLVHLIPEGQPGEPKNAASKRCDFLCRGVLGEGAAWGLAPEGRYLVQAKLKRDGGHVLAATSPLKNVVELNASRPPVVNVPLLPAGALAVEACVPRAPGEPFDIDTFKIEVRRVSPGRQRSWKTMTLHASTERGTFARPSRRLPEKLYLIGATLEPGEYRVRASFGQRTSAEATVRVLPREQATCALKWPQ